MTKAFALSLILAATALGGCGRLGDLEAPAPRGEPAKRSTDVVMDPTQDSRAPRDAPIPGSNPH